MDHNNDSKQIIDYDVFLKQEEPSLGGQPPPFKVIRDLVESRRKLALVYVVGSILGYLTTLVICAQCSFGLTPLSWRTAALIQHLNETTCALVCGVIFGIGPFLASSLMLSRFEHRFLLFKMTWLVCIVPIVGSVIMTVIGTPHSLFWHGFWAVSAIATPYILESLAYIKLKQGAWPRTSSGALKCK